MDRRCHSELAFRVMTDSGAQCSPASTQLAFSSRWTERWLRRQFQSHPVQRIQTFLWALVFSFTTKSNLLLSSVTVTKPLSAVTGDGKTVTAIYKIYGSLLIVSETTFTVKTNTKLLGLHCCPGHVYVEGFYWQQISFRFPSICSWNQGHVLLRPRLFNICVLGCALSESCYFCLGDRVGNEAKKRHSLQLSLWTVFSPRLPPCKQGQACHG